VDGLAQAANQQIQAWNELERLVRDNYREADEHVETALADGALLRGEVLARWQEFVGTGDLMRAIQAQVGKLRNRITAAVTGKPPPGSDLRDALVTGLAALIEETATEASEKTAVAWRSNPAGAALITPALEQPGPDLTERSERLVRDWQRGVF